MSNGCRVIAIGSPHGDDQVAWRLAERLRSRPELSKNVITLNEPLRLLDHLDGCDRLVILDACYGNAVPGTVTRLEWPDERIQIRHAHSSHGFGPEGALQLAEKLDRMPPNVVLFGIEIGSCAPGDSVSEAVESALGVLESTVLLEMGTQCERYLIMHEQSIVRALLRQVEELAADQPGRRVLTVRVSVGEFSGVDADLLHSAYDELVADSLISGAKLELTIVPIVASCLTCAHEFIVQNFRFRCPQCDEVRVKIIRGEGLVLESITLEEGNGRQEAG